MKHPAGYAKPRRTAAPSKKVRLNLQRRPKSEPEDELETRRKSSFWKWVLLVALLHLLVIGIVYLIYETAPTPKPPEQFITLLPEGNVVKGTPGAQEAHKLGSTTPASAHHTSPSQKTAKTKPPKPIQPKPLALKPLLKMDAPTLLADKPITPPPPAPPKTPKVKVDLTQLEDAPATDKPVTKPKPHLKKPAAKNPDDNTDAADNESTGLSKQQIAAKLGDKTDAAGVKNATLSGTSGSDHSQASPFADFYAMLHDQVMEQWTVPNLSDDAAVNPMVEIHVEKDGRVPADGVHLVRSSGNEAYDDSAVAAAKGLGYLHEPLPDGCPPDISITFKPNR